jgi:hypothetical protein
MRELLVQAANKIVNAWTLQDLKTYAFDRMADELMAEHGQTAAGKVTHGGYLIDFDNKKVYKELK